MISVIPKLKASWNSSKISFMISFGKDREEFRISILYCSWSAKKM